MSDVPQRASASQMAARSFSKRPTGRRKPITTPAASPQPQQQSFPSLSQNNNLFGNISGSGDFNFSAGGPSISFSSPQPSFGGFNTTTTNNNNNHNPPSANNHVNPNTTFSFGSATSDNSSNNSFTGDDREESMGKRRATSSLEERKLSGSINETDKHVPLFAEAPPEIEQSFSATTGVPYQAFTFGTDAPPPESDMNGNPTFTFGTTIGAIDKTQGRSPFGNNPFAPEERESRPAKKTPGRPRSSAGLFGAASASPFNPFAPAPAPAAGSQSTNIFGASASTQNNLFAPAASTGSQGGVFGEASAPSSSASSGLFASSAPASGQTNIFGAPSASAPASSNVNNIFAPKPATGSQGSTFGGFGQQTADVSQPQPEAEQPAKKSSSLFGSSPPTQPATPLFGASTPAQPSPIPFGSIAQSSQASTATSSVPTNNMFGNFQQLKDQNTSQSPAPAQTPGLFQTAASQAPSMSNVFGGGLQSSAPATPTLFGNPQPAASSSTSNLFGSVAQAPPQQPTGLFGTSGTVTPGGSLFDRVEKPDCPSPATTMIYPGLSSSRFNQMTDDANGDPFRASTTLQGTTSTNGNSIFGQAQPSAAPMYEPPTASQSIFDQISRDNDGNPIREFPQSTDAFPTQSSNSLSHLNQPMPDQSDDAQFTNPDLQVRDPSTMFEQLSIPSSLPQSLLHSFSQLSMASSEPFEFEVEPSADSSSTSVPLFQPEPSLRLCQCLQLPAFKAMLTERLVSGAFAQYFVNSAHPALQDESLDIIERAVHEPGFLQILEESLQAGRFEHFDQFEQQTIQIPQITQQPATLSYQQEQGAQEQNHVMGDSYPSLDSPHTGSTMFADLEATHKPGKPEAIPLGPARPSRGPRFGIKRSRQQRKPTKYHHHRGTMKGISLQLVFQQKIKVLPFTKTHKVVATFAKELSEHDILLELASYPPCLREVLENSPDSLAKFTTAAQQLLQEARETQKWPAPSLVKKNDILNELVEKIKANANTKGASTATQPHAPPPANTKGPSTATQPHAPPSVPAAEISEEFMNPLIPAHFTSEQRLDFYVAYRIRALNIALQKQCSTIPSGSITAAVNYYNEQRDKILSARGKPYKSSKRKADLEGQDLTSTKRARETQSSNQAALAGTANTITQPKPAAVSSNKTPASTQNGQLFGQSATIPTSKSNGTAAPFSSVPPSASPTKNKRKAEYQISDRDPDGSVEEQRQLKMPQANGNTGSETSNIFKTILDSPKSAPSPTKKVHSLDFTGKAANNQTPRANPFATIQVPGSSSKPDSSPSTNIFTPKPAESVASPTQPASSQVPNPAAQPVKPPNFSIKPPTFGSGPVNFLAQFGQQAKKDEKDNEEKLMEKAKEEDMDSDDDEAEWEAKYKEKRKAELKELEELATSKRASFVAGKGFTFGDASKASAGSATAAASTDSPAKSIFTTSTTGTSNSLFGQTPTPSSGGSIFGSVNGSRASTPGGSVLDSHTAGKTPAFSGNIFGHLSGPNSPANGQDKDSDDESDHHGESDSENKDPTYQPTAQGSEAGSGPTTPVEKTGAGVASAKKAASNPFAFGSKSTGTPQATKSLFGQSTSASTGIFGAPSSTGSGTSTPGGGLFGRISKDSNGNPIRQLPAEEKENTQPNTTNIFGSGNSLFSKSNTSTNGTTNTSDASASSSIFGQSDKTWKPDSPIRFGSATKNDSLTAMPTVNVTDATPTKPNVFGGLFGSSAAPKPAAPTSGGLFGSAATPSLAPSTGAVGWSFGGPPSTASSLLPSAAGSAATSRATSPGLTTDGDSAAEGSNDPDAEHHEQIDLTKGGPGEEHEACIHEVRAKALKFSPSDTGNPWVTKGLGPLRVLKHKDTKAARVLLRADPSGTIVLNKGILAGVEYTANGKTLKFLAASDSGSGLETWMLQVKTPESANALAQILEESKSSS